MVDKASEAVVRRAEILAGKVFCMAKQRLWPGCVAAIDLAHAEDLAESDPNYDPRQLNLSETGGLSARVVNMLEDRGISTLGRLCEISDERLLEIPGIAAETILAVRATKESYGLIPTDGVAEDDA